jgi:hypothetical protein
LPEGQAGSRLNTESLAWAAVDHPLESQAPSLLSADALQDNIRPGYLIITPDAYSDALAPFVRLKQAEGHLVSLARLSQVGDSPAAIRDYVRKAYQNGIPSLVYLLLVGDTLNGADSLPSWTGQLITGPTDLYYATLDGADWVPDLLVGRLPARSAAEVSAYTARAVAFAGRMPSDSWLREASFVATCDSNYNQMVENTHNTMINGYTMPFGFLGRYPTNPQAGGDRLYCLTHGAGQAAIQNAVTSGRLLVTYSGHGTHSNWEMGITTSSLSAFAGSQAAPLVMSYACQTGDFNTERSLGEAWISDAGALAFIGASDNTYWGPDDRLQPAVFASLFGTTGNTPVSSSVGGALQAGLSAVQQAFPSYGQFYYEAYHVLGDPSVRPLAPGMEGKLRVIAGDPGIALCAGSLASTQVQVEREPFFSRLDGGSLAWTAARLPDGVTAGFTPGAVYSGGSSRVQFQAGADAVPGLYSVLIGAQSSMGLTVESGTVALEVAAQSPSGPPQLTQPAQDAREQPVRPELRWDAVAGASGYDIEIAADEDFKRLVDAAAGWPDTHYTPRVDLGYGQRYFWRVKARNACGGVFSAARAFTVKAGPQSCPANSAPYTLYHEDFNAGIPAGWEAGCWLAGQHCRGRSGSQRWKPDLTAGSRDECARGAFRSGPHYAQFSGSNRRLHSGVFLAAARPGGRPGSLL